MVEATTVVSGVLFAVVYAATNLVTVALDDPFPRNYLHVLVRSGRHGVIPVALALSLDADVPHVEQLQAKAFGVVVGTTVVQGLLMPTVLELAGVTGASGAAAAG